MVNACAGADLGDDALREVFALLLGLRDLLCCAATCKRWRRHVTDRDFLGRVGFWPDTARRPCVLAGIFSQTYYSHGNPSTNNTTPYAPPRFLSLQAGLDVHPLTFDSFVTIDGHDKRLFDVVRPLAARRGFLLTRVLLPSSSPAQLRLAVCRPLLDRRSTQFLPPPFDKALFSDDNSIAGCAIITAADHAAACDGFGLDLKRRPMFQVLLIYNDDNNGFLCARTYSSDTPEGWSAPVKCRQAFWLTRCALRAGVVTHGMVRWLFKDDKTNLVYTLNISLATSRVTLTKIPIKLDPTLPRPPIPCIAGEEGTFSFVTIQGQDQAVANLWTSQEQDDDGHVSVWQNSQLAMLGSVRIDMVFFAESRGALLVEQGGVFYIVDLKGKEKMPVRLKDERTKRLRGTSWFPVYSCSSTCCHGHFGSTCVYTTPVLYEIDWAFMSTISSQV